MHALSFRLSERQRTHGEICVNAVLKKIFPAPPRHKAARETIHICENSGSCQMQGARPRHTPCTDMPLFYFKFLIMYCEH